MPKSHRPIALSPRPWLTRGDAECAFPTGGEGRATIACCNPCAKPPYCEAHRARMRGPRAATFTELEREFARFLA